METSLMVPPWVLVDEAKHSVAHDDLGSENQKFKMVFLRLKCTILYAA